MSSTAPSKWREQYDRMKRIYARLSTATAIDAQTVDDCQSFFVWCFHLKDWLKNDPSVSATVGAGAEVLVNSTTPLSLCADLANGAKHMRVTRTPRVDADLRVEHVAAVFDSGVFQADVFQTKDVIIIVSGDDRGTIWDAREEVDRRTSLSSSRPS